MPPEARDLIGTGDPRDEATIRSSLVPLGRKQANIGPAPQMAGAQLTDGARKVFVELFLGAN
jgi:hypothetical protein